MPNRKSLFAVLALLLLTGCFVSIVFACEKNYSLIHSDGLYIVKINTAKAKITPYVSEGLETVDKIAQKTNADIAINSGFFDAKNRKSVSFITENGNITANPENNENLTSNPVLKPHLDKIFNRGELRLYDCNGVLKAEIVNHKDKINEQCNFLSSTQAGPILLPDMDLEKEFFILKKDGIIVRDSIGTSRRTDRSAFAVKDKYMYFIITDENTRLTISELRTKLQNHGFEQAIAFDGGGSVSLFVRQKDGIFYQDREEKGASRAVKSALIVRF